uniref:Uncharacterized protein n=1 Tax=Micrurus spixii TaxID=129469 RepID=A0A2D4N779_9SAUR
MCNTIQCFKNFSRDCGFFSSIAPGLSLMALNNLFPSLRLLKYISVLYLFILLLIYECSATLNTSVQKTVLGAFVHAFREDSAMTSVPSTLTSYDLSYSVTSANWQCSPSLPKEINSIVSPTDLLVS